MFILEFNTKTFEYSYYSRSKKKVITHNFNRGRRILCKKIGDNYYNAVLLKKNTLEESRIIPTSTTKIVSLWS